MQWVSAKANKEQVKYWMRAFSILLLLLAGTPCDARPFTLTGRIVFADGNPVPATASSFPGLITSVENRSATGGNADGICDAGEVCIDLNRIPARYVNISVRCGSSCLHQIAEGTTDSDGRFTLANAAAPNNEAMIIMVWIDNAVARVLADVDWGEEGLGYRFPGTYPSGTGSEIDLGTLVVPASYRSVDICEARWLFGACTDPDSIDVSFAAALNINQVIWSTWHEVESNRDPGESDTIEPAEVEYCDQNWNHFNSIVGVMSLTCARANAGVNPDNKYTQPYDAGYIDKTIAHEYGHHLEWEISTWDGLGGKHSLCKESDSDFSNDPELAWSEGFPDYLSWHMVWNDSRMTMTELFANPENPCMTVDWQDLDDEERWVSVEGLVAGSLWDLDDGLGGGADSWDIVDGLAVNGHRNIIQIFDKEMDRGTSFLADAGDFRDFYEAWVNRMGRSSLINGQPALDMILNRVGIVPRGESGDVKKMAPYAFVESNPVLITAGENNDNAVPGGNKDGVCDPSEYCIPGMSSDYTPVSNTLKLGVDWSYIDAWAGIGDLADTVPIQIGVSNLQASTMPAEDLAGSNAEAGGASYTTDITYTQGSQNWLAVQSSSGGAAAGTLVAGQLTGVGIRFPDSDADGIPEAFNLSSNLYSADVNLEFQTDRLDGSTDTQSRTIEVELNITDGRWDDADSDALTNEYEMITRPAMYNCLDPRNADSDDDRLSDGEEINGVVVNGTVWHTHPCNADSDNDGYDDYRETRYSCFDPLTADNAADPLSDPDGDLLPNQDEEIGGSRGSDPCDPDTDDDGADDNTDNCPRIANPSQSDLDGDTWGDLCDTDIDGDLCPNHLDPEESNPNIGCPAWLVRVFVKGGLYIPPNSKLDDPRLHVFVDGSRPLGPDSCKPLSCPPPGLILANENLEVIGRIHSKALGFKETSGFPSSALWLPDRDGDGVTELAVSTENVSDPQATGAVVVLSSKTGNELGRIVADTNGSAFGASLASLGNELIAIGAPGTDTMAGRIYIADLNNYKIVRVISAGQVGDQFGRAMVPVKDMDNDGVAELIVGAPKADGKRSNAGAVYFASSAEPMRRISEGRAGGDRFGQALTLGGTTKNGMPQVLVGAPGVSTSSGVPELSESSTHLDKDYDQRGEVVMLNLNGHRSWSQAGRTAGDQFGASVAAVAIDPKLGHVTEFLVGAPGADPGGVENAGGGYLVAADGQMVGFVGGSKKGAELGGLVAAGSNFDEDGFASLVLIETNVLVEGEGIGRSIFYQRKTLSRDVHK